jgi:flagellar protein FlaI
MKLGKKASKKEAAAVEEEPQISAAALVNQLGLAPQGAPTGYAELESYPLIAPFSYARIVQDEGTSELLYVVDELQMSKAEKESYAQMKNVLESELKAPVGEESMHDSFTRQLPKIVEDNQKVFEGISPIGVKKIQYFLERDIVGYGRIDPMMNDPNVEDVRCGGINKPIFLWHRKYENIKTNVFSGEEEELNDFVMKIVHKSGKHISIAYPIVDATLPGKHRLAVSYGKETTPFGTSYTIRKFREDPFTIIDLINSETINESIGAYLWLLIENKMPMMIVGATGAGKTTALNATACLIHPSHKIITVEEVAEINLPHENWTSTIARSSFGAEGEGEISLYDLIKSAVRHRPDLIAVGEIRGEEAYVLFQALATGHGGLCTMHAEDAETAIKRLTQPPMNIPESILTLMNVVIVVRHIPTLSIANTKRRTSTRRFVQVAEVIDSSSVFNTFTWNPSTDTFNDKTEQSIMFERIIRKLDVTPESFMEEYANRKKLLLDMAEHNVRDYHSVNNVFTKYYHSPNALRRNQS